MKKIKKVLNYWYIPFILGVLYIIFGLWVFLTPLQSFLAMAVLFSVTFVITGVLETLYAISNRRHLENWGWSLVGGLLSLFVGFLLISKPGLSALMISFYIGFWILVRSIMTISTAIELKEVGEKKWGWTLALAIGGVLFSLLLLWNPVITGITVAYWAGFGLVTLGILHILLGMGVRRIKNRTKYFLDDLKDNIERSR